MADAPEHASQTAGPYVHIGCMPNAAGITGVWPEDLGSRMITGAARGERITLTGRIFDGAGAAVTDAMVELWQADAEGRMVGQDGFDPGFAGWGRTGVDPATGAFRFVTLRPGPVAWHDGRLQAPHLTLWIAARGINLALQTRAYFDDLPEANADDPVLRDLVPPARVPTLIARRTAPGCFACDIHLQGPDETVFFDI